jgi:uncharacterized repeat protein (TIGR03943 family)
VTTRTQGLLLAALAVVLIRISLTGEYLHFVATWMRWPLLVTGVILLGMAFRPALRWHTMTPSTAPGSAWLLFLPAVMVFVVAPPPLGAYLAERRADQPATLKAPESLSEPTVIGPLLFTPGEFAWGASQPDDPMGLAKQEVRVTGFVTTAGKDWFLTQLEISCCAADAMVVRIRVEGHPVPPRDQWVQVTGDWVEGTGRRPDEPAAITASDVVEIPAPEQAYG